MKTRPHLPALSAVLSLGLAVLPTYSAAQTLQEALNMAYRTNPTIAAAKADYRAVRETKAQARAGGLPQITASASLEYTDTTTNSFFNQTAAEEKYDYEPRNYGVQAEQAVFQGFRNINALRQASARVKAGGAQLVSTEQQVLLDAATAYFDVIRDVQVFEANRSNVEVLLRQLKEAELRFKVGEITKTDVAQAQARLAGARAELATAQARLAVARANFRELMGDMPGTLEDKPDLPIIPQNQEDAQRLAMYYAPTVVAARQTEKASRKQIAIARGTLAPSIALTANYSYAEEPSIFTQDSETLSYGARATVPIFQGGANYSRIREAKAANRGDRQRIREAERRATASVTSAWEQLVAAQATIRSASAQVEANALALEGVRRENQVGTRTTLDVLNAEQELLNAKVNLANAERDERSATFSVLAAMGVLTLDAVRITQSDEDRKSADGPDLIINKFKKKKDKKTKGAKAPKKPAEEKHSAAPVIVPVDGPKSQQQTALLAVQSTQDEPSASAPQKAKKQHQDKKNKPANDKSIESILRAHYQEEASAVSLKSTN